MGTYCVICKKNTVNENSMSKELKKNRLMVVSNCTVCHKKKSRLIKNQVPRLNPLRRVPWCNSGL